MVVVQAGWFTLAPSAPWSAVVHGSAHGRSPDWASACQQATIALHEENGSMEIAASVASGAGRHDVCVTTDGRAQTLEVAARPSGTGSAVNGGEFLMLALATCYCNDLYREAAALGIVLEAVEVEARADFEGVGLAASNVRYRARVTSSAGAAAIGALLDRTDAVAEVHNTLRAGAAVVRREWDAMAGTSA